MLVLTRKIQQQIQIGPDITITILQVKGKAVRVGIEAPLDMCVLRSEVAQRIANETAVGGEPAQGKPASKQQSTLVPSARNSRRGSGGGKQTPSAFSLPSERTGCRAPRADRAPLIDYLKRSGPASFSALTEVVR